MKVQKLLAFTTALTLAGFGCGQAAPAQEEGAKGLYFAQLEQPKVSLNTGVQYWIELHRDGQIKSVTNKHSFKSGDRIKFHVRANIDGFAYIVLKTGSRGERSVLFPESGENNKVSRGKDYAIPKDDFLTFDANPGTERVTLLLSRTPLDAEAYLKQKGNEVAFVSAAAEGSKDLAPGKIVLAVTPPATAPIEERDDGDTRGAAGKTSGKASEQEKHQSARKKPAQTAVASKPRQTAVAGKPRQKPAPVVIAAKPPEAASGSRQGGVVTIVQRDPTTILAVDVDLDHHF